MLQQRRAGAGRFSITRLPARGRRNLALQALGQISQLLLFSLTEVLTQEDRAPGKGHVRQSTGARQHRTHVLAAPYRIFSGKLHLAPDFDDFEFLPQRYLFNV